MVIGHSGLIIISSPNSWLLLTLRLLSLGGRTSLGSYLGRSRLLLLPLTGLGQLLLLLFGGRPSGRKLLRLFKLHLVLSGLKVRLAHLDVLGELILGQLGLLALHIPSPSLLLSLQLGPFHLRLILFFLHFLGLFLEANQAEFGDFFLYALLPFHFVLLMW